MEFAYLTEITGDPKYVEKVEKIREVIVTAQKPKNLYPNYLNPKTGKWGQQHTSVGALGDSFYEYLLKEWIRSGKRDRQAKKLFDDAATEIENELVRKMLASGVSTDTLEKRLHTDGKMKLKNQGPGKGRGRGANRGKK